MAIAYKTKDYDAVFPPIYPLLLDICRIENTCQHILEYSVYSSFIHNSKKLEEFCPMTEEINIQGFIYLFIDIYSTFIHDCPTWKPNRYRINNLYNQAVEY